MNMFKLRFVQVLLLVFYYSIPTAATSTKTNSYSFFSFNAARKSLMCGAALSAALTTVSLSAFADDSSKFIGSYKDPVHPGWTRLVSSAKDSTRGLIISGSDHKNGAGKWAIRAIQSGETNSIMVDFHNGILQEDWHSPASDFPGSFEGQQDVSGIFDDSINGIRWADGNTWIKNKKL